jgi:hypothetical protein
MSPIIALKIWRTYVIQKLLYGIKIMTYTKTDLQKLERLQLKILKQFQGLSERTANVGVYSLLGIETIEVVIDRNTLSFLGGIIRNKSTIEFAILERELSMSKTNGNCYAIRVSKILQKYNLPILSVLIDNPPTKLEWKSQVKRAVHIFWETTWQEKKTEKSTLKYLSLRYVNIGQPHYMYI